MAALAIPAALSIAPQIISLITGLVHHHAPIAQATTGPGTGAVRFADVFTAVMDSLQKAATAGTIDKSLPSEDLIKVVIQAVVTSLKMQGQLTGSAPSPLASDSVKQIVLAPGQSINISA